MNLEHLLPFFQPGIHTPEPVCPRTTPHQDRKIFRKVGPHRTRIEFFFEKSDRTAPGPKKPQKFRTNSHRAVYGPGGAWIPGFNVNWPRIIWGGVV